MSKLHLISGRHYPNLARKISRLIKTPLTPIEIKNFANGEIYVRIQRNVRGGDIFLIQSLSHPVNENIMELLITIDALKRASAGRINVICPHLAYSRQDRKNVSREPITAKLLANLITTAGADRLVTVDLHADQIQGFYDIPVDHFVGYPLFAEYFKNKDLTNTVITAPDIGGVKRARKMAGLLHVPIVIMDKRRQKHNQSEVTYVIGEVKNKKAIIVDDIIDTAGTACEVAKTLKQKGAKEIILCATHGLLSDPAEKRLQKSPVKKIILLDTVPLNNHRKLKKIKIISIAPLLSKVIKRIHQEQSLGALFTWEKKVVNL